MDQIDRDKAVTITKELKTTIRGMLDKHAAEISRINQTNDDPHAPVVGCTQMALVQASLEYLITCGCKPNEAVQLTLDTTSNAVNQWLNSILKPVEKKAKRPGIIKP